MDAHWLRLHHGTYTDPKWRVIVARCHAASRPVTTASVLAVWMCMLETASQAEVRGTLDGWCHEDVAAALGIAEADVAAIYDAMQGKTLADNRLIAWEKRQPKREREDSTATERKRAQREREAADRGVTGRDIHASRHVSPRGEERREEDKKHSVDTPRSGEDSPSRKPSPEPAPDPTLAALACKAMREAGVGHVNPSHPDLLAALADGATVDELRDAAVEAVACGKPRLSYIAATVRGRRRDAATAQLHGVANAAQAPPASRRGNGAQTAHPSKAMTTLMQLHQAARDAAAEDSDVVPAIGCDRSGAAGLPGV